MLGIACLRGVGAPVDTAKGLVMLGTSAQAGHTYVMAELGRAYLNDEPVPLNVEKGTQYFLR